MIKLHFEKIYNRAVMGEETYTAVPFKKGELLSEKTVSVVDKDNKEVPTQLKVNARWDDGSIKWLFIRFKIDIEGNCQKDYFVNSDSMPRCKTIENKDGYIIKTDRFEIVPAKSLNTLFESIKYGDRVLEGSAFTGPWLVSENTQYDFLLDNWEVLEKGDVVSIVRGSGYHYKGTERVYKFEVTLTFYSDKEWFEIAYRIINTTLEPLKIKSLRFLYSAGDNKNVHSTIGISNYKTKYIDSDDGSKIYRDIDAKYLSLEANEHNAEVFYGTFLADYKGADYGLCATIYQAQQNFPKAFSVDRNGMCIILVPEESDGVIMQAGMARKQRFLLHFHKSEEDMAVLNFRSTLYQMPCKPEILPEVFEIAKVFEDVFVHNKIFDMEMYLELAADDHARCYGMMNWGDAPDAGYTEQGRGGGKLVWTNNEYDFPHACTLMYARTGLRKYLEYMSVATDHWMDVDICHYSDNPLLLNGQWEHTQGHCVNGEIVCSHQWVEGLLDCYHLNGNEEAYNTAIEIGKNVLRLLDTPEFKVPGAMNARETGWAMRTLVALYKETNDESWLEKCDFIVSNFEHWENEFGHWLSYYMNDTSIRVVFMISIAVGSLMRYYRVKPKKEIKDMILRAVDDLMDNARLENGLFYYKELPSLKRPGNNPLILEALAIAYELTNNIKYIEAGLPTLNYIKAISLGKPISKGKKIIENTMMYGNGGTKGFGQMLLPVATFYKAASENGLLK